MSVVRSRETVQALLLPSYFRFETITVVACVAGSYAWMFCPLFTLTSLTP